MTQYRFFIEPVGEGANEAIAELLNNRGDSAQSLEQKRLKVIGRAPVMAYELPEHYVLTLVRHAGQQKRFRAYVQEGSGVARLYRHFKEQQGLERSKPVREARQKLASLRKKK